MSEWRDVRVTREFVEQVDRLLPAERTGTTPSRRDFQASDLLAVVDTFRARWDDLPRYVPRREEWRVLITTGRLVPYLEVVGELTLDGAVELVLISIDLTPPEDWNEGD